MNSGVTEEQKAFILKTIKKYFPHAKLLFFGSRFAGNYKPHSDLDLCIQAKTPLDVATWAKLNLDLTESDLPFKVDLIDWNRIDTDFHQNISNNYQQW